MKTPTTKITSEIKNWRIRTYLKKQTLKHELKQDINGFQSENNKNKN